MQETDLATPQQIAWQDRERGVFCHFGLNTFHDQEWGEGTDPPDTFRPSALDARQWVRTARQAGFQYFVLTAKHHDGFCLWPTATTDYSVKASPWRGGAGDVVRECADACRECDLPFGLYLSPWDRHEPCYADPAAYDDFYCAQLTELVTCYGPLVEVWFDGAGSEGRAYDWRRIIGLVRQHQPDAMIFNMGVPTIRWVGNEDGLAPYPCWNTAQAARLSAFTDQNADWLPETPDWLPAECDVPIRRPHWFWHPDDEARLLSLDALLDIYYRSVGHGANLLLNVAPDDRGLFPESDAARLIALGDEIRRRFAAPLAVTSGQGEQLDLTFPSPQMVDHVILMEDIAHGERVRAYVLEADCGITEGQPQWKPLVQGSAIGHKKIDRFAPVVTARLRLRVLESSALPLLRQMAAFHVG